MISQHDDMVWNGICLADCRRRRDLAAFSDHFQGATTRANRYTQKMKSTLCLLLIAFAGFVAAQETVAQYVNDNKVLNYVR